MFENITLESDLSGYSTEELLEARDWFDLQSKKKDLTQKTMKVLLNSCYGIMGNQHFAFFRLAMAEAITLTGQFFIKHVAHGLNDWLRQITGLTEKDFWIASDTDSAYLDFSDIVKKYCGDKPKEEQIDKICKFADTVAQAKIKELVDEASAMINAFDPSAMAMDREAVCDGAVFTGKKRYVLSICDLEGFRFPVDKPKIKITGLESKKAIFSQRVRTRLEDSYKLILKRPDLLSKFVAKTKEDFMGWPVGDIAEVKSANKIAEFEKNPKGCPLQVRAAIVHNRFVKEKGLMDTIQPIESGSKIKYVHLRMPNPANSEVIAFEGDWKEGYGLDEYVDYPRQFEKVFMQPLGNFTKVTEYDHRPQEVYELF